MSFDPKYSYNIFCIFVHSDDGYKPKLVKILLFYEIVLLYLEHNNIKIFIFQNLNLKKFNALGAKTTFYNLTVLPKPTISTLNRF